MFLDLVVVGPNQSRSTF